MHRLAGDDYARWVRAISIAAAVGYPVVFVTTLLGHGLSAHALSQLLAGLAALASTQMATRRPTRAAVLTLVAVWVQLQFGFLKTTQPYAIGTIVTPALVAGAGLLLGARWSLVFAASSAVAAPVLVSLAPALRGSALLHDPDVVRYFVVFVICNFGMWVVVTLGLRAFGRALLSSTTSEQQLAETIRLAPDGILVVGADARVVAVNPAAERILAIETAVWLGRQIGDLLEAAGADEDARSVLHSGRTLGMPLGVALHRRASVSIFVEVTSRAMRAGQQQWMLRDVSERVRAEQQRRSMETQLAHVQRMEAVGQLAGGIAHDFNNLLTAIGASAELLRLDCTRADDHELIDEIIAAQERGSALTRQLLSFARRDFVQRRVFNLAGQVQELQRLLARVAGERVRFSFSFDADCRVHADVGQMEQALVNLVSNARDAMPEGGACHIGVVRSTASDGTEWVTLSVRDDGAGMDEATKRRAFEPFFTTKPRGKGTGLGLASVHGIVQASSGRTLVDSAPGRGTTITLEFPFANAPLEIAPQPMAQDQLQRAEGSVLVAEDDEAIRATVQRILTRAGYTVTLANDGLEAARIAEARSAPFDLVLTDVIMPSATGPQLVARLRRRWPGQPALFMSGYPEDALAEVPDLALDRDFLAKPFTPSQLEQRVAEAIGVSRGSR